MSLLRFAVVPLLKVNLVRLVLLQFRVAFKASSFSKVLVALSIEFHATVSLYEKLFLPSSVLCERVASKFLKSQRTKMLPSKGFRRKDILPLYCYYMASTVCYA